MQLPMKGFLNLEHNCLALYSLSFHFCSLRLVASLRPARIPLGLPAPIQYYFNILINKSIYTPTRPEKTITAALSPASLQRRTALAPDRPARRPTLETPHSIQPSKLLWNLLEFVDDLFFLLLLPRKHQLVELPHFLGQPALNLGARGLNVSDELNVLLEKLFFVAEHVLYPEFMFRWRLRTVTQRFETRWVWLDYWKFFCLYLRPSAFDTVNQLHVFLKQTIALFCVTNELLSLSSILLSIFSRLLLPYTVLFWNLGR